MGVFYFVFPGRYRFGQSFFYWTYAAHPGTNGTGQHGRSSEDHEHHLVPKPFVQAHPLNLLYLEGQYRHDEPGLRFG
ncbi:MAG: hypothetical protein JWQ40_1788 [Segetibacter sp.]|nr:hypothetical protein [Segetibacter sp.]